MPNILDEIIISKLRDLEITKNVKPLKDLESEINRMPTPLNLSGSLMGSNIRLIAESKKASPSKGLLSANYDPISISSRYADNGVAAISVLTETNYFQGTLQHMKMISENVRDKGVPVLRKDFIVDPYQVYEARAYSADAILLIVSLLTPDKLKNLLSVCSKVWIQALVEVHDEIELGIAIDSGAEIIGINNRDLKTFHTDISITETLAPLIPKGKIIVSESGIHTREDIIRIQKAGANAALIGEALMVSDDPSKKIKELLYG
jgi:indole-3-glycerol phosphate synthase